MRINIYTDWIKISKQHQEAVNEYIKRNSIYCKVSVDTINNNKIKESDYTILINCTSSLVSSTELADKIKQIATYNSSTINFIITSENISSYYIGKIDEQLSISKMNISQDFLLIILTEQIYRAYTIINGKTYHK